MKRTISKCGLKSNPEQQHTPPPWDALNEDSISMIFSFVSLAECVVGCCVSKPWREMLRHLIKKRDSLAEDFNCFSSASFYNSFLTEAKVSPNLKAFALRVFSKPRNPPSFFRTHDELSWYLSNCSIAQIISIGSIDWMGIICRTILANNDESAAYLLQNVSDSDPTTKFTSFENYWPKIIDSLPAQKTYLKNLVRFLLLQKTQPPNDDNNQIIDKYPDLEPDMVATFKACHFITVADYILTYNKLNYIPWLSEVVNVVLGIGLIEEQDVIPDDVSESPEKWLEFVSERTKHLLTKISATVASNGENQTTIVVKFLIYSERYGSITLSEALIFNCNDTQLS